MKKAAFLLVMFAVALGAAEVDYRDYRPEKNAKQSENIVWNVFYSYNARDTKSPRALLIGDSVCRGYHSIVREELGSKVNLTYWATSNCVTDIYYLQMLDLLLDREKFDLIVFNNGLHSLSTNRKAWSSAYGKVLDYLAKRLPETKVVVLNSTPKKDGDKRVDEINELTKIEAEKRNLPVADIHSLCKNWDKKFWRDAYHFQAKARKLQAKFVAETVLKHITRTGNNIVQLGSETGPDGKVK